MMAAEAYRSGSDVLVLNGDAPFVEPQALRGALDMHRAQKNAVTLLSARLDDPFGYGRVIRGEDGAVAAVVEERDADEAQRAVCEINSGAYWFDAAFLAKALEVLTPKNAQGEYYLTDTVAASNAAGLRAGAFCCCGWRI